MSLVETQYFRIKQNARFCKHLSETGKIKMRLRGLEPMYTMKNAGKERFSARHPLAVPMVVPRSGKPDFGDINGKDRYAYRSCTIQGRHRHICIEATNQEVCDNRDKCCLLTDGPYVLNPKMQALRVSESRISTSPYHIPVSGIV